MKLQLPFALLVIAACGASPKPPVANQGSGAPPPPPADPKAVCAKHPDQFGPYELDAAQADARYGRHAMTYAAAPTTKDKPVEVCGVSASLAWLMSATCANGKPAYPDMAAAHESRSGSVGGGGRCGAIIDLYVAKCPEAEYQIYVDMYMCGPGENFME